MLHTAHRDILKKGFQKLIPALTPYRYKGNNGKIGIVGGSINFIGAPCFTALAALKSGADLAYIITTAEAAIPIKQYCADFIVHPKLPTTDVFYEYKRNKTKEAPSTNNESEELLLSNFLNQSLREFSWILERIDVLVIGPGLGKDPISLKVTIKILTDCIRQAKPIVIDADGIRLFREYPETFKYLNDYKWCVFTPNKYEEQILREALGDRRLIKKISELDERSICEVASSLVGPTFVGKGFVDCITNGYLTTLVPSLCITKRAGGIGDILTGAISTFMAWAKEYSAYADERMFFSDDLNVQNGSEIPSEGIHVVFLAVYGASLLVKLATTLAFEKEGRGMISSTVLDVLPRCFKQLYEEKEIGEQLPQH